MAECVSGVVIAAPFIGLTRAWEMADWQIVGGLAMFTVGSPVNLVFSIPASHSPLPATVLFGNACPPPL